AASYVYANLTSADLAKMNNESSDSVSVPSNNYYMMWYFPVPMDIVAYATWWGRDGLNGAQYSLNTTNGVDGTWTNFPGSLAGNANNVVKLRTMIMTLPSPITSVRSIRLRLAGSYGGYSDWFNAVHLYGQPTAAGDRLSFWDPTLDQELAGAALDFGDVQQGNVQTKTFRVKNESSSLTANSVTVDDQAPTDFTPSVPPQYDYSTDGGVTYAQTASLGNLGPGAISGVVTVRKSTPTNAALSLHTLRITATASSWS
ncbi:MAG TPA: hypothetical protein VFK03_01740, partial [Candidatus Saccharimonadales bacterium]|nr:hypothetical protein [Candidatus Saccharimonadales bacterium]